MNKFLLLCIGLALIACSKNPQQVAEKAIKAYLKETLKNPSSYEPGIFGQIDSLKLPDSTNGVVSHFTITHSYTVVNSSGTKVTIPATFYLGSELTVTRPDSKILNGEPGKLQGNAYWKFNDFIGNKPDAGSEITLFATDSLRKGLKFEATADVNGNYEIAGVLPGHYFLVVRSKNATDCPDWHLTIINIYRKYLHDVCGLDTIGLTANYAQFDALKTAYTKTLNEDESKFGGLERKIIACEDIRGQMMDKAASIIEAFPKDFKRNIMLVTPYSNAYDMEGLIIEDEERQTVVSDFGITCI